MGNVCCHRDNIITKGNKPKRRSSILLERFSKLTDFKTKYDLVSILGNGGFGKVRLYRDKNCPKMKYAIKTLKKDFLNEHNIQSMTREVEILTTLDHPNIVKYFETYENEHYLNIVM
jgi:calcium-dependent protein kinase